MYHYFFLWMKTHGPNTSNVMEVIGEALTEEQDPHEMGGSFAYRGPQRRRRLSKKTDYEVSLVPSLGRSVFFRYDGCYMLVNTGSGAVGNGDDERHVFHDQKRSNEATTYPSITVLGWNKNIIKVRA